MNTHISPRFEEQFYKGQDIVHEGIRIPLKKESLESILEHLDRLVKRTISVVPPFDVVPLELSHLAELRKLWFDPSDETFPSEMGDRIGWTAVLSGEIIGGIVLSPSGKNLFLHQLISGEKGKELKVPTQLMYWAAKELVGKEWNSIDVGVSYNPKRYEFFRHFAIETYPVILKKPFQPPTIRLSPFDGFHGVFQEEMKNTLPENSTFAPRGTYALLALLKHLGLQKTDCVTIIKTFGSQYIPRCVTDTIEKVCDWRLGWTNINTKAYLIIHEFGVTCNKLSDEEVSIIKSKGTPIIEDCAWRDTKALPYSDYWFTSEQKMHSLNYGSIIHGVSIPDDKMWEYGCFDFVKRQDYLKKPMESSAPMVRAKNWLRMYDLMKDDGMETDACYDWEGAVRRAEWTPTIMFLRTKDENESKQLVERLNDFGVQAGVYWGEPLVFLPIHQNMSKADVDYVFAVVRGYYNLCANYGGNIH